MPVSDTSSEAAELQLRLLKSLTPSERVRVAVDLSDAVRETTMAGIRRRHPEYSREEAGRAFLVMLYGDIVH
jgi:hypothetical protein